MRTAFREHLDGFSYDLLVLSDHVRETMRLASKALINNELTPAEEALSAATAMEETRQRCEERAVALLLLEGPMARDLRQIISSIYIVEHFDRMGALGMHIARVARRRHPNNAVPAILVGYFEEMSRIALQMSDKIHELLLNPDADVALVLSDDDDAMDDLHAHIMHVLTQREWKYSTLEAVDVTLLSRYYERFADHTVDVAARIVYLTSGMQPEEYRLKLEDERSEEDFARRIADLERRFSRD
ncbi:MULTISPECIES: PhoU domain-containing protein [unclassified Corynebacterium]|uniref:phosphate signaling complex PhoU family protein n=1 Tax=unclassified Corynebacterium TaxID=2624378 RepID=UPI001C443A35|nr:MULTISPECIES: PhoU domain-containing protein [unclassified Corynebacterium]MBV7282676.1 PhoU family transcriptional regulator [Corynebacterium sp. TAE3-ERU30]MBV7301976.1 PhoU family transcriptional regulator [Corynebacterium sp. TAE3-ERU2]